MSEIERLKSLVKTLSDELYRVRTKENEAAVELEKIKTALGFNRNDDVSISSIVAKINFSSGLSMVK